MMRERIERSDNLLNILETETDQILERMQLIDEVLQKLEASISLASQRRDYEVGAALEKNLSNRRAEKEDQKQIIAQIAAQLSNVGNEISAIQEKTENSKQEIINLESLGEETSDGQARIQAREQAVLALEQRYRDLVFRLQEIDNIEGLKMFFSNQGLERKPLRVSQLEPNFTYEKNGYLFQTDEHARVKHVSGLLHFGEGTRNPRIAKEVRELGQEGDEAGHILAKMFGGPADAFNYFAQNEKFNAGKWNASAWSNMESEWKRNLQAGRNVFVSIELGYEDNPNRPSGLNVHYEFSDGRSRDFKFSNQENDQIQSFSSSSGLETFHE